MQSYKACQIKRLIIEIDNVNIQSYKKFQVLKDDLLISFGIYRIKEVKYETNKLILKIEFPIWERDEIAQENLENFLTSILTKDQNYQVFDCNPHFHFKKELVYAEEYPYKKIGIGILTKNKWAQKEVLGKGIKSSYNK